jgi:hypothetical protein
MMAQRALHHVGRQKPCVNYDTTLGGVGPKRHSGRFLEQSNLPSLSFVAYEWVRGLDDHGTALYHYPGALPAPEFLHRLF